MKNKGTSLKLGLFPIVCTGVNSMLFFLKFPYNCTLFKGDKGLKWNIIINSNILSAAYILIYHTLVFFSLYCKTLATNRSPYCFTYTLAAINLPWRAKKMNIVFPACNDSEKAAYLYSIRLEVSFPVHPPDTVITRKTTRQGHISVQLCCCVCGENHCKATEATTQ